MENLLKSHFRKLWRIRNKVPNRQSNRNLLKIIVYEMRLERESRKIIEAEAKK